MSERFYVETPVHGQQAVLAGAEAHHLAHVVRARPGQEVTLFDGSGAEFTARIERIGRGEVVLAVLARTEIDRELRVTLSLAVALPKGDRQRWLVEKAVELGVARLIPLVTARGVAQPGDAALRRLRRTVIEASKQCGRNRLMEIAPPLAWPHLLAAAPTEALRLVAHPGGETAHAFRGSSRAAGKAAAAWLAIGPEGGFVEDEVASAAQARWQLVDLGPRIMRVETAAVYLTALVAVLAGPRPSS